MCASLANTKRSCVEAVCTDLVTAQLVSWSLPELLEPGAAWLQGPSRRVVKRTHGSTCELPLRISSFTKFCFRLRIRIRIGIDAKHSPLQSVDVIYVQPQLLQRRLAARIYKQNWHGPAVTSRRWDGCVLCRRA